MSGPRPRLRPDQGLRPDLPEDGRARPVDGDRDARGPPDRPARRVWHDRQRRRHDAAPGHRPDHRLERQGRSGRWPTARPRARRSSAPRRPTSSPTSWPATPTRRSTRSGASGPSTTARPGGRPPTRPAPPATTATWPPTAIVAPPADKNAPALAVGVWMGNSDNTPNDGKLSLDTSAPLWSAILTEVSKGEKIATSSRPRTSRPPRSMPSPASSPDRTRPRRSPNTSCRARSPAQKETLRVAAVDRRRHRAPLAGRLPGPEGHPRLLQPVGGRVQLPGLAEGQRRAGAPGRPGAPAFAAGRRAPERRTSTTARSRRSAGPGVRRSCRSELCPEVRPARLLRSVRRHPDSVRDRRRPASRARPTEADGGAAAVQHRRGPPRTPKPR